MTADFVAKVERPNTVSSLTAELGQLGVKPAMTLMVHTSLSALGFVAGGPVAVVQALLDTLGPEGTLAMPTHSADLSDPANWHNPPVPEAWWPTLRAETPAYDPRYTPTWKMGAVADVFRAWPGTLRSAHPSVSFSARGPQAQRLTSTHELDFALGEGSPLARLYDLDGWVLLLGVGHERNTSFHLAEYRAAIRPPVTEGAPVLEAGRRVWREMRELQLDDESFAEIGAEFDASSGVIVGHVGAATARLFRQRPAVDFAVSWLRRNSRTGA
ncbi:MAG: AAC(3) family N-acetyltransferase [Candidatus Wallbacteria bacterium]|nr:AAC(3) family N-acetyltransferase [Candidatus Wallbacteria bacterium]